MLIMQAITVLVGLAVAFGVSLTQEQAAGLVSAATIIVNLVAYYWKSGQEAA
jgi:hypothetical protein